MPHTFILKFTISDTGSILIKNYQIISMFEEFHFKKIHYLQLKIFEHCSVLQIHLYSVHISLMWVHLKNHNQTEYLMIKIMDVPTTFLHISITVRVLVYLTEYSYR